MLSFYKFLNFKSIQLNVLVIITIDVRTMSICFENNHVTNYYKTNLNATDSKTF